MMPVMHLRCFGWETGLKALPTLLLFNSPVASVWGAEAKEGPPHDCKPVNAGKTTKMKLGLV